MPNKYHILLAYLVVFSPLLSVAQNLGPYNPEEQLLELLSEELGEDVDLTETLERLSHFLKKPLNLNQATASDLLDLVFLNPQQIANLLLHREQTGSFINLLELQGIAGFTPQTIVLLQYFVTIKPASPIQSVHLKDLFSKDEHSLMLRYGRQLERQQGYKITDENRSRYLGDPNRYALRYRWNYENKIKIAFNAEKDAGEPFFAEKQRYGFDFYSGNMEINGLNRYVKKLVIGDYALQFGQGLVTWNGLSFGKGAWVGSVAKQGVGLKGYTSLNESNFQRGVAVNLAAGKWEWTPFIAYNSLSGRVEETPSSNTVIRTISITGLHRTPTELSYRQQIKQLVYGSNISFQHKRLKLGLTYMGLRFNGEKIKATAERNKYDFEGQALQQIGINYQANLKGFYLFGETAHSINSGLASINGVIASPHPKLSLFATYRNYTRDYHSFYAHSLGEGSSVSNEEGLYGGFVYHPSRKIEWVNYADFFRSSWLRFRADLPSEGTDLLSQFTYTWHKKGKLTFRYRYRLKQENFDKAFNITHTLAYIDRHQGRIDFQYKLNDNWTIRTRSAYTFFEKEITSKSQGLLVYQDLFWKGIPKLDLNMRAAYFDTDDYDSRIYAYENDVLYASSFPMYYDKGFRSYLNLRWRIKRKIDLWARYAITHYAQREDIGSGLDKIEGNKRSDIKLQVRVEW